MNDVIKITNTYYGFADILIAGSLQKCRDLCLEFCLNGFCVNVSECDYIYTGGTEGGCRIGLINYARFPMTQYEITAKAIDLAEILIIGMHQSSASVLTPDKSFFLSRRDD